MKLATTNSRAFGLSALALGLSIALISLMVAPASANAFWWPWGKHHVHAQGHNNAKVTVTIQKYIDGEPATSENADGNAFPMVSSWDDPYGIGKGNGSYALSTDNAYTAKTSAMKAGADYSTSEVLDGDIVSASCDDNHPYTLAGYSTGASLEEAAAATISTEAPSFTDLESNQYVIVWNESCDNTNNATSSGNISGEVTGGFEENQGSLTVTSIDAEQTIAIANGEFEDGWKYVFNITVPSNEPNLAMKFADWVQTDGEHNIPVAGNMRISSDQSDSATSTVTLSAADTYSSPELHIIGDLNEEEDGLQVQVLVEVAVPAGTYNGTYTTEYGVRTLP